MLARYLYPFSFHCSMKVIEFVGMPRAGKSTQINLLRKALTSKGKRVKVITDRFRASQMKTPPTEVIAYKLVFFSKVLEDYFRSKGHYDYLLIDRGFVDSTVWFDVEHILGHISSKRAMELKDTFLEFVRDVDQIVCLMVDVSEAAHRHEKTKHMKVDEVGMSEEYLTALDKAYQQNSINWKNCLYISELQSSSVIHEKIVEFVK